MGKGEIARYEQFLLFPPCFQKDCFPGALKGVIIWQRVKDRVTAATKDCTYIFVLPIFFTIEKNLYKTRN